MGRVRVRVTFAALGFPSYRNRSSVQPQVCSPSVVQGGCIKVRVGVRVRVSVRDNVSLTDLRKKLSTVPLCKLQDMLGWL